MAINIHEILKKYWGYDNFRPLQTDIIEAALAGKDALALMPTGGGKSICFQVPALAQEGFCLVISPLIALMKDQVYNLRRRNIRAEAIYSGMSRFEIDRILDNCIYGKVKLLYLSPERLLTEMFQERLPKMNINLVAIDEAHCISQWGYDFRPPYLQIADIRQRLPNIPFLALTATATKRVVLDIQEKLAFKEKRVFQKSFKRDNLSYSVFMEEDKPKKLLQILQKVPGTGIVYVSSRKKTKSIALLLQKNRIKADFYHAGLNPKARSKKQEQWMKNKTRVMVCTNAFGMGIDKPDVRVVVHIDLPNSLEAYYQEAGRAGRDLRKSYAVLLYQTADVKRLHDDLKNSFPELATIKQTYQSLANYYQVAIGAGEGQSFNFNIKDFCQTYNLSVLKVFNSLKILEQNNYFVSNDAVYSPSRLMFIVPREEIYKIEVANRRLDPYIKGILRTYGGAFDDYINIDEAVIARNLRTPKNYVVNALNHMHQHKLIDYQAQSDQPQITFTHQRLPADRLKIDQKLLQFRKEVKQNNIAAVEQYVSNSLICRSQQLLSYFGELDSEKCKVCDVCTNRNKTNIDNNNFKELETAIKQQLQSKSQTIHELVDNLSSHFKEQEVVSVIRWLTDNNILSLDQQQNIQLA